MDINNIEQRIKSMSLFGGRFAAGRSLQIARGKIIASLLPVHGGEEQTLIVAKNDRGFGQKYSDVLSRLSQIDEDLIAGCPEYTLMNFDDEEYILLRVAGVMLEPCLPSSSVVKMAGDIGLALKKLHEKGLVHRNIKPGSICYCNGKYYLIGFELTDFLADTSKVIAGTRSFMAPEALNGSFCELSDVYSLCLTLYSFLNNGALPFQAGSDNESINRAIDFRARGEDVRSLIQIPSSFMNIIKKGLQFDKDNRFSSINEFNDSLQDLQHSRKATDSKTGSVYKTLESSSEFCSRFKIAEALGSGSYGSVFRTVDRNGNECAVKVIPVPSRAVEISDRLSEGFSAEQVSQYYNHLLAKVSSEALVGMQLSSSKNIVKIYDYGRIASSDNIGGTFWMSMELLSPIDFSTDNEKTAVALGMDICKALAAAHSNGFTHRDVKQENIFYSPADGFKLGDFGIAKLLRDKTTATIIGTKNYMAPELLRFVNLRKNSEYDKTVDIYALGMTLYTMLNNGVMPFADNSGDWARAEIERCKNDDFPRAKYASDGLMRIIKKACSIDPQNRYITANDMLEALCDL